MITNEQLWTDRDHMKCGFRSTKKHSFLDEPGADPINFFLCLRIIFPFFAAKLGHFIINYFFLCVKKTQIKHQK